MFELFKPTLLDIPQMRSLILDEVKNGILLDRSEDEMANAILSYIAVRKVGEKCRESRPAPSESGESCESSNAGFNENAANPHGESSASKFTAAAQNLAGFAKNAPAETAPNPAAQCNESAAAPEATNEIVGFVALHIYSLTLCEVRSLNVRSDCRGHGLGTMLINALISEAKRLNLKEILTLTYRVEVFERLGFAQIAKEKLPNHKIWTDCVKCKRFPLCDEVALIKQI